MGAAARAVAPAVVSIHAPHEGERPVRSLYSRTSRTFQSTLPTRGSDESGQCSIELEQGFNPRSPRGGATLYKHIFPALAGRFNPRSPRGGATGRLDRPLIMKGVSIHAPHEGERRSATIRTICPMRCFNPRSPRGGATRHGRCYSRRGAGFNPRSPRGGATSIT